MRKRSERTEWGKAVAKILVDLDMSPAELAKQEGKPEKYFSDRIYGKKNPTLEDCFSVALAAGTNGDPLVADAQKWLITAAANSQVKPIELVDDDPASSVLFFLFASAWMHLSAEKRSALMGDLMSAAYKVMAENLADVKAE